MEKCAIFIDGGYLNRVLKNYFNAVDIDYLTFCNIICKDLNVNRLRTYYYHSLPIIRKGNKDDERRYSKMKSFIDNLKRLPRFEVKLGKLQLIGNQFRQKMVDVLMSIDIIKKSSGRMIKQIIIIAGDADFVPAIKTAKDNDIIIHLFYHSSSIHNELLDEIDESHLISKELIDNCKK
ncbi:NYN domain-containing protein [Candidatus Pacearchaeota archaeon]|nr:NYN domain-containing protein [Candidatus Pacearchaeota archaeon]